VFAPPSCSHHQLKNKIIGYDFLKGWLEEFDQRHLRTALKIRFETSQIIISSMEGGGL
jgi:hypothetical protein